MVKKKNIFCIILSFCISLNAEASIKSTFTYGNNKDYAGQNVVLQADLYKPYLFSTKLPLVIIYHGGGYAAGDKNMAMLKPFANYFNAANISAVIPDFRQGWYEAETKGVCESASPEKFEDAAHRAYQDNRALIRYCKANATALGIDSGKIFLFGISSGGFLVMHSLYMNDATADADRIQRLGGFDLQSNNLTNSTDVAGIISVVGGFYSNNAAIIKKSPLLLFNNTCDGAVDFYNGWIGNCSNAVRTYGPGIFTKFLEQYNNPYSLHVFCGYPHGYQTETSLIESDPTATKYISEKSISFIKETILNTYTYTTQLASDSLSVIPLGNCNNFETFYLCKKDSIEVGNEYISLIPNPITCLLQPKLNIRHAIDETLVLEVIDESGKLISQQKVEYKTSQNIIYLKVNDFTTGINILLVKNNEGKVLYKTKVMRYCEF